MIIGFDAKRAVSNFTGLGNYSRSTLHVLMKYFPSNKYLLYSPEINSHSRIRFIEGKENVRMIGPESAFDRIFKSYWRSSGIVRQLKKDKPDIYHGLSHELPMGIRKTGIKTVVTIHDLIYLRFPEYFKRTDRKIYDYKFRYACQNADKIIAISEQTKADLLSFFEVDEKKIEVVYQSCDPVFSIKKTDDELILMKGKYRLPEKFVLSVGTLEERKNVELLIKALRFVSGDIKAVVVGRHTSYIKKIQALIETFNLQNRVIFMPDIHFEDLPALYQSASVFVYPSRFEGFGIPIIEALSSGCPVIASNACTCLTEAGGSGSIYVGIDEDQELANAITQIMSDESIRQTTIQKGLQHVEKFREKNIANNLMSVYEHILNT